MPIDHDKPFDPDEVEYNEFGERKGSVFPSNAQGRLKLMRAIEDYRASGKSLANFFGGRPYYLSESGVRKAAQRLRVELSRPQRTYKDHRKVLVAQRQDGTPPDVVAHREGVKVDTLRSWSKKEKLPFVKNTKLGRRQWWYKQLKGVTPFELPSLCVVENLPWKTAVIMYHDVIDPVEFIAWDFSPRILRNGALGGVKVSDDFRPVLWTQAEYESAIALLPGATDLEEANLIAGHRKFTTPMIMPDHARADDPDGFHLPPPPKEVGHITKGALQSELPVREFGATTPFDEEAM